MRVVGVLGGPDLPSRVGDMGRKSQRDLQVATGGTFTSAAFEAQKPPCSSLLALLLHFNTVVFSPIPHSSVVLVYLQS